MPIFQDQKQKNIANFQKAIDEKRYTISKNYDEIGRLYYGQFVDINVDNTKTINSKCDTITKLKDEIEELDVKILREKGLKKCPVCRTENNLSYAFCFKCGARFDDNDSVAAPEAAAHAPAPAPAAKPAEPEEEKAEEPEAEAPAEEKAEE
ncbi:MAG: hypothetical protein IKQ81_05110 [Clostridiales bacterium]|nr:hypothetical protein [Clostridiales bacterium]